MIRARKRRIYPRKINKKKKNGGGPQCLIRIHPHTAPTQPRPTRRSSTPLSRSLRLSASGDSFSPPPLSFSLYLRPRTSSSPVDVLSPELSFRGWQRAAAPLRPSPPLPCHGAAGGLDGGRRRRLGIPDPASWIQGRWWWPGFPAAAPFFAVFRLFGHRSKYIDTARPQIIRFGLCTCVRTSRKKTIDQQVRVGYTVKKPGNGSEYIPGKCRRLLFIYFFTENRNHACFVRREGLMRVVWQHFVS